jgi:hypothetical protein
MLVKISKTISNLSQGVVTNYALYFILGTSFYLLLFTVTLLPYDLTNSTVMACLLILISSAIINKQNNEFDN